MDTDTPQESIATCLRAYRKEQGFSQQQFATLLGVTQGTISQLENGSLKISPAMAKRMEKVTQGRFTRPLLRPDIFT